MTDHEPFVREYLAAIEGGATGPSLARFFTEDVVQEEFPNRLMPSGARRNLTDILQGAERGQSVLQKQQFIVHNVISSGDMVVAEVSWIGTLAIPLGTLSVGSEMKARFCFVLEVQNRRIKAQRNYDCFDPF